MELSGKYVFCRARQIKRHQDTKKQSIERMSLYKVRSLIFIILTMLVYDCAGQGFRNPAANTPLQTPNGTQNSILLHKPVEQISQVVRMMFQDSKGNIWFGGAYRLENERFINITKDGPW